MTKIYSHTLSLCNICKEKIPARIIQTDNKVFMEKKCPEHGFFETLISSDINWYEQSRTYVKAGQIPLLYNQDKFKGCPESCGFCTQHQQHTCLPVIEINHLCDLTCPICLKGEGIKGNMTTIEFAGIIDNLIAAEGKIEVVNISGGEPSLHPQLVEMLEIASDKGIGQISLSTNGLELLTNEKLRSEIKKYNVITALQFDGFSDDVYIQLRGEALLQKKLKLIKLLEKEDLMYSLVASIAKDINHLEVKAISDFFFQSKALTLMFQPITFTGFAENADHQKHRITIDSVVKEIEKSSFVNQGDFNPLPCSHFSCFALAYFLKVDDQNYYSMKQFLGLENYLEVIANKTLPGLDKEGFSLMKQRMYEFWSAADSGDMTEKVLQRIKGILVEMNSCGFNQKTALDLGRNNMKAIFIHHFMDVYNFDFSRLVKCCNPYPQPGNKLIPICAQNVLFKGSSKN